ncbi:MAG TPA: hypothetical protein VG942_00575 [Hyphomonadaceae bacterium]|nr:hypothetical protein [Hyphomonadaceae bacterium]
MKRLAAVALFALVAACSPKPAATPAPEAKAADSAPAVPANGPEAAVAVIYKTLVDSKGQKTTPVSDIPMTADLDALLKKVQAASPSDGDAPVFDGDLAGNCQDCSDFGDLKVELSKAAAPQGHTLVDAHFTLFKTEPHTVTWDMVETPEGWRVDNIVEGTDFDARKIANEGIAAAAKTKAK